MKQRTLIIRSLRYYLGRNTWLALGIAISTAVLTGSLIVGDSVSYSLHRIVENRLGNITHTLSAGDRYFTLDLVERAAEELNGEVAPVIKLDGMAVAGGGQRRLPGIQVLGVDATFDLMAGTGSLYGSLAGDQVVVSENLADRLGLAEGGEFLLRMTRASLVPMNAPFVSDADNTVTTRVTISHIATVKELGAFNLKNSQTAPLNLFMDIERLNELMDFEARANILLADLNDGSARQLEDAVQAHWKLVDIGLNFRYDPEQSMVEIKSDRVFIDSATAGAILHARPDAVPVLTYFVNALTHNGRSTPYSFVSTLPDSLLSPGKMIVNTWLANDLGLKVSDEVVMKYYAVGLLRELETRERRFEVAQVVTMEGIYGDEGLMPEIPGLSDAGNCRDWDTGVPISLDDIRDKDEDYWDRYKGTPKAFIARSTGGEIWENRFGKYTSFRVEAGVDELPGMQQEVLHALTPPDVGFLVQDVLAQADYAAANGVDFSELFAGLSFFLLAGAILLSVLLFRLNLEERSGQVETLSAMGITRPVIRQVLLWEGMLVALAGVLPGLLLAVLYNNLVFNALNGIWHDIVRTDMLVPHVRPITLFYGFIASLLVALPAIALPLNRYLRAQLHKHRVTKTSWLIGLGSRWMSITASVTLLVAMILIFMQLTGGDVVDETVFFAAGGLLLVSGMLFALAFLLSARRSGFFVRSLTALGIKNTLRNTTRSLTIVVLFSIGTFLVISTGSNRKDLFKNAGEKSSGTGGFLYYAESTVPVLQDLSYEEVRFKYGLGEGYSLVQMRVADGDDASCLNLNRITNPRILGVDPIALRGRFSFVTRTDHLDETDPWGSLQQKIPAQGSASEVIPAIADETVIKWGLGMTVGDTLTYSDASGNKLKLLLIGGLAPSVFQGNVLISEEHFIRNYPASSGTEVFLVEGPVSDTATIAAELNRGMRDLGWHMEYAPARLAEFNSITNTYLSIFLVMGALGLLLGTVGLAVVLFRSILERREELAVMRALGFGVRKIRSMIFGEYIALLFGGTLIGSVSAVVATLPALLSTNNDIRLGFVLVIVVVLLLNGAAWIGVIARLAFRRRVIVEALRNE